MLFGLVQIKSKYETISTYHIHSKVWISLKLKKKKEEKSVRKFIIIQYLFHFQINFGENTFFSWFSSVNSIWFLRVCLTSSHVVEKNSEYMRRFCDFVFLHVKLELCTSKKCCPIRLQLKWFLIHKVPFWVITL